MLELSSLLLSLHIYQWPVTGIGREKSYFFGLHNSDWSLIICKMFERKLNKLLLVNEYYYNYIPKDAADFLRKVRL